MVAPLAVLGVATGVKILGSILSGEAEAAEAEWNAAQARYAAAYAKQKASIEERRVRKGVKRTVGTARTAAAASGFALESESTQLAIDDIERSGEIDAALIRHQGDIGEWKGLADATAFEAQADSARFVGFFGALTSVAETATLFSGSGSGSGSNPLATKKTIPDAGAARAGF
jgi:hypothetical protein